MTAGSANGAPIAPACGDGDVQSVLMVAYHFPPLAGSSGIQRTLRFVQQLPTLGWTPLVLTAHPMAYERTHDDPLETLPPQVHVERAIALDTGRHLSIRGRYIGAWALPDRWASWRFDAVRRGMQMIRRYRPRVLWSTYPIATAHLIAAELHRRSGLPWVADFRDPMAQDGYPADPATWQRYADIERHALRHASRCLFATPGAARDYRQRYPDAAHRIEVLENGYDESAFAGLPSAQTALNPGTMTLLHSGIVYPTERDPTALFVALKQLRDGGALADKPMKLRFRAPVHDALLRTLGERHGVTDLIQICPPVPYREALAEMLAADALLVLQAANCNAQIPAKVYEYLRCFRPLIGLTDPAGDTAELLQRAGIERIAPLDEPGAIAALLQAWLRGEFDRQRPRPDFVASVTRLRRSEALAACLGEIARNPIPAGVLRAAVR